jgi:hypothetical protein
VDNTHPPNSRIPGLIVHLSDKDRGLAAVSSARPVRGYRGTSVYSSVLFQMNSTSAGHVFVTEL